MKYVFKNGQCRALKNSNAALSGNFENHIIIVQAHDKDGNALIDYYFPCKKKVALFLMKKVIAELSE
jgi:hypothetical protein